MAKIFRTQPDDPTDPFACWGVYAKDCGTRRALARVADKWTVLVVGRLSTGPRRFGELRRLVEGISSKVLAGVLRELEADGLVRRTVLPTSPPSVEYALTQLGASFVDTAQALRQWAERHAGEMDAARAARGSGPGAGESLGQAKPDGGANPTAAGRLPAAEP